MCKIDKKKGLNIQLILSLLLVIAGIALLMMGFWVTPIGVISNSVLIAFGEICTFAGSLVGVDYHYRFKTYVKEENKDGK